jgi:hypothetical protein
MTLEIRCICGAPNISFVRAQPVLCWNCGRTWQWDKLQRELVLVQPIATKVFQPITDSEAL